MDGKGRALEDIYIERFWRTIKYQHIYLNPADDGITLYQGICRWIDKYNHKPRQGRLTEASPLAFIEWRLDSSKKVNIIV